MIAALSDFHFLRPAWLLLLAALPVLAWAWRRAQRQRSPWTRIVDPHLLPALLDQRPVARSRGALALVLLVTTVASLALAGPAWRQLPQPLVRNQAAWVLAIDLSDRMRATDLAPSRLARIRFKIADLLRARSDGQIALIAYAGDAFPVAPLTEDGATLQTLLPSLEPDVMPEPGQRADRAIELARQLLRDAGFERGDVLLFTDRADARAESAAADAQRNGVRVSVLGVGTPAGAPVPLPSGGFLQRSDGEVELAALDAASLQRVASAGGGRYVEMASDPSDLQALDLSGASDLGEADVDDEKKRALAEYRDEGPWLVVLLLLPLAALAFRRGWLGCVLALMLLPPPQQAQAFELASLWKRDDQRAWEALQNDDPQAARALAQDPQLRGSAAYRSEDYGAAVADFAGGTGADAHYNRGNALARAGRLQEAIDAYDAALKQQPGMEDAIANRKVVEDALKQQQQQDQQNEQQEGDSEGGEQQQGEQQPQDGEQQKSEQGESQQNEQQGDEKGQQKQQQGESGDSQSQDGQQASEQDREAYQREMEQAMQDAQEGEPEDAQDAEPLDPREREDKQAAEQWLRRIPDDPGGLLRAKFLREHRRRQEEGRGAQ